MSEADKAKLTQWAAMQKICARLNYHTGLLLGAACTRTFEAASEQAIRTVCP